MRWSLVILLILFWGCQSELPDRKALIEEKYRNRESKFLSEKDLNCRKEATEEAQIAIDSMLDFWVNANLFDTLNFPDKPIKPKAPDHIIDKVSKFEIDQ